MQMLLVVGTRRNHNASMIATNATAIAIPPSHPAVLSNLDSRSGALSAAVKRGVGIDMLVSATTIPALRLPVIRSDIDKLVSIELKIWHSAAGICLHGRRYLRGGHVRAPRFGRLKLGSRCRPQPMSPACANQPRCRTNFAWQKLVQAAAHGWLRKL